MTMPEHGRDTAGQLFIVSTPIGHLGDITYRAVETLGKARLIAAEDTRRTGILLRHYNIHAPLVSFNSYNKDRRGPELIARLRAGDDVALVTDAGTPGISDPLFYLAQLALAAAIRFSPIPGPTAAIAALCVSGLPTDRFVFEGFLPRKKGRQTLLSKLALEERTIVLFESPMRLGKTLRDLYDAFGERRIAVARELTKIHEEVLRGNLSGLANAAGQRKWKGEITLVIAGRGFEWAAEAETVTPRCS